MGFVPFISSGASSRLHYVLVRKVETAPSPQAVDDIIFAEMQSIVRNFTQTKVSSAVCREYLIILLYCINTSTASIPTLDSALPHAVSLAEAGSSVSEKRIGYMFCAEVMPARHELQLMLVNTLRKDLESVNPANISLALDHLIQCPFEDVIPAIQYRLHDLLAHNSPQIRRRALLALNALSIFDFDLMSEAQQDIIARIEDPDDTVCNAALVTASTLYKVCICSTYFPDSSVLSSQLYEPARLVVFNGVNDLFRETWSKYHDRRRSVLIRLLDTLRNLGPTEFNISLFNEVIIRAARQKDNGSLLRSVFLCLPLLRSQLILTPSDAISPASHVRFLLTSREPNQQYLFLTCLECLDPQSWAGTTPDVPALLEQWEVDLVMGFLDSQDPVLRRKTIKILHRVDTSIISSYYKAASQNLLDQTTGEKAEHALPLFEILEIQTGIDGERYARDVSTLLGQIEASSSPDGYIFEGIIDMVLTYIHHSADEFRRMISTCLLTSLKDMKLFLGPTTLVIMAALACENSGQLYLPWDKILEGLSSRIAYCPIPVQDTCLLSMLRITADCSEISPQIFATISKLNESSGRHIRKRCEQFLQLATDKETLSEIIQSAQSSTLPDFLEALQKYQGSDKPYRLSTYPLTHGRSQSRSPKSESLIASKLRYEAYDAPVPTPRLRGKTSSNSNYGLEPSALASPRSFASPELLAGGELALAASTVEFENEMAIFDGDKLFNTHAISEPSDTVSTAPDDLIAFDSPFILEPSENPQTSGALEPQLNFDKAWGGFSAEARGWYGKSIEQLLRRVRVMDPSELVVSVIEASLPPFLGELKVMIRFKPHTSISSCAVLRLKESEEVSCLWRLRGDLPLYVTIKNLLTED
ncbi:armadillo-type protein [Lentinula aciculospora]|uniref:Armadillo-type protein n=1 Tax=Lentinula aciculospora TaxID=153920 RepID=A0A9W8ZWH4_9AGAR|nr:armadillo-type protein [Lentinula aciculospora]